MDQSGCFLASRPSVTTPWSCSGDKIKLVKTRMVLTNDHNVIMKMIMVYGDDEDLASVVGVSSNTVRPCLDSLRWWFWRIKTYLQLICLQSCQQWKKTIFVGRENERQTNHLERSCSHKRSAWSSSITWIMLDLMKTLKSSTCLKLCTFGPSAPFQSCLDSIIVTISSSSCTKSFDWQHGQWSPTQSSHDLIYSEKVPTLIFPTSNHHKRNLAWFFSAPVFQMRSRSHSVGKTLSP